MTSEGLEAGQFLVIGDHVVYALGGARQRTNADGTTRLKESNEENGDSEGVAEEQHFLSPEVATQIASKSRVAFVDQQNYVPRHLYEGRTFDRVHETITNKVITVKPSEASNQDDYIYVGKNT